LYALGVDRVERLMVLRFLGALISHADPTGRVHARREDVARLADEAGLLVEEADRSSQWLQLAGVVHRHDGHLTISRYRPLSGAVAPAEAIDAIAQVLARPCYPTRAQRRRRTAAVLGLHPSRWAWRGVAVAAAALAVVASLLSAAWNHGDHATRMASTAPTPATAPTDHAAASGTPNHVAAPQVVPGAAPIAAATFPRVGPIGTTPAVVTCPLQTPVATVGTVTPKYTPDALNPGSWLVDTTVTGTLRNPTSEAAVVDNVTVVVQMAGPATVAPATYMASALPAPVTLFPGASVAWTVTVTGSGVQPSGVTVVPDVSYWHWVDPALATCRG
jgi:hypothetical protein